MKFKVYKPNKNVTGCAADFSIVQAGKDLKTTLYISMIQQSGWDDAKRLGSFKGSRDDDSKNINFKISATEAGEILASLKTGIPFVAFHKFDSDSTIIRFTPWNKKRKIKEGGEDKFYDTQAWGLSVSRNSNHPFKLPLEQGETEVLATLLKNFIEEVLTDEAQQQQMDQSKANPTKAHKPKEEVKPAQETEDDIPF